MGIGMRELLIILLVVLVIFGTKKLRTVGQDLGAAVRGFKKAMSEGETEQSAPPKQLGTDAEFEEVAKKTDSQPASAQPKSDRSV
ncbi:MAG TPA: twin-arginine translocase TatA/TatE family subunit [Steroidobacteraceae bacterium]|nr:twin-arginine translocase TatA/TatE family subunit [Steroidobacteraceae bacterium]